MATGNQKGVTDNLRKRLAPAVRSTQWSYAIFWSLSARVSGSLEWSDGYYNGDIKTRKTVQAIELNSDPLGLQRSDQLRELFESLSLGETSPQPKRPTAALSPEDITDTEWYFLVYMSFVFKVGQGMHCSCMRTLLLCVLLFEGCLEDRSQKMIQSGWAMLILQIPNFSHVLCLLRVHLCRQ